MGALLVIMMILTSCTYKLSNQPEKEGKYYLNKNDATEQLKEEFKKVVDNGLDEKINEIKSIKITRYGETPVSDAKKNKSNDIQIEQTNKIPPEEILKIWR